MDEIQIALSWDGYQKNICSGLSLLQQRGEFVDMTLAADGKHVKVHQMVMSLVSPYIKELISTAQCPHPVIFLYNMSYTTLCSILEYIYSGELLVTKDNLYDIIAAGKALRIKGLEEMTEETNNPIPQTEETNDPIPQLDKTTLKISPTDVMLQEYEESKKLYEKFKNVSQYLQPNTVKIDEEDADQTVETISNTNSRQEDKSNANSKALGVLKSGSKNIQYSVTSRGGLQIIVNRFIYTLKYVQKKNLRFWRCNDCTHKKCRATIYTNYKNEVVKRKYAHNHPFHDQKILYKHNLGLVFTAYSRALNRAQLNRTENAKRRPPKEPKDSDSE